MMPRPIYSTHVLRLSVCCTGSSWPSLSKSVCDLINDSIGFEVVAKS